ncbi:hypothetical protein BaRGS_00009224 [Batillaria attramentaria]|uniref:Uncharacterized protein n=1 Tax=Batillaria attramentaria TaxID=370345 RepID=A0ABD0LKS1_9CAEN
MNGCTMFHLQRPVKLGLDKTCCEFDFSRGGLECCGWFCRRTLQADDIILWHGSAADSAYNRHNGDAAGRPLTSSFHGGNDSVKRREQSVTGYYSCRNFLMTFDIKRAHRGLWKACVEFPAGGLKAVFADRAQVRLDALCYVK